jgi:hypothetical protein
METFKSKMSPKSDQKKSQFSSGLKRKVVNDKTLEKTAAKARDTVVEVENVPGFIKKQDENEK